MTRSVSRRAARVASRRKRSATSRRLAAATGRTGPQCGNCTGLDACGVGGTPNVCAPAVSEKCGGCAFGGELQVLYNTTCDPTNPDCYPQSTVDVLCGGTVGLAIGCGLTCDGT